MTNRRRWSVALLGLALLYSPSPARADDVADEADLHFQLGAQRYQAGDFTGALEHFMHSNRLVPNKNVLFNIARCYESLGQFPNAWRSYSAALDGEADPKAKTRIQESLERIGPQVAVIQVETDPPGAVIYLDRKDLGPRGEAPRALGLAPGEYVVIVERPGHEAAQSQKLKVGAGSKTSVKLKLKPLLGILRIEGEAGAEVRIDTDQGPPAARVPAQLKLEPGAHRLFLRKPGTRPTDLEVEVTANRTTFVRPKLQVETGTVVVASDLREALIEVDGEPKGFTPAVLTLPVGAHKVSVSLSGFRPVTRPIAVKANAQTRVDVELAREQQVTAVSRNKELVEEAPSSVSIIPGAELRAMGYPTIAEAVRGVRGVYLSDDRSYTTLGFRGFSRPGDYGNKVLVLYDGHPFNDNILYQSFPGFEGRTDIEDVERIEVVRGPGSALYGTGAVFGVVNVVTHERDKRTKVEAGASAVEYSMTRGRVHAYYNAGHDAGAWVSASAGRGAGRDFFFPEYLNDSSGLRGEARNLDDSRLHTLQGRVWWKDLTLQAMWNHRNKTIPSAEYETIFGDSRNRFIDDRAFVEARFEPKLGDSVQSLTRAHYNLYDFYSGAPYDPADGGLAEESYKGRWAGLEQRFLLKPVSMLSLTLGGEVQRHFRAFMSGKDETGDYLPANDNPFTVLAAYAVGDVELDPRFRMSLGVRYDRFAFEFAEPLGNVTRDSVNPRLAIVAKPYSNGITKLIAGRAFRAPTVYEIFYQSAVQDPSPDLKPEQLWSGELEHTHLFGSAVSGTVAAYGNYVDDLIVGRGSGTTTDHTFLENSSSPVLVLGGEAEVRRDWRSGWMVAAQYSFSRARYLNNTEDLRKVPNSPQHLAAIKGAVPILGRTMMAMSRVTLEGGRYDRLETPGDPAQGHTDAGLIWDLVLSGELMNTKVRYNLGAYNIADWHYSVPVSSEFRMLTMPQAGRTLLANLNVEL